MAVCVPTLCAPTAGGTVTVDDVTAEELVGAGYEDITGTLGDTERWTGGLVGVVCCI